jgi:hypothetical protein
LSITRWSAKSLSSITRWRSFQISKFPKKISKATKAAIPATSVKKFTTVSNFCYKFFKNRSWLQIARQRVATPKSNLGRMGSTHLE